ncbi:MAG TPA: hypothetical protein VFJ82_26790 [Longimicrobium sp.]|nr:hypothetical protein [Longimicrobium sp.]
MGINRMGIARAKPVKICAVVLLAASAALAACGDEDRTQTEYTASADKNSTSADDSAATPAPAAPTADDTAPQPLPPQISFAVALSPLARGATVRAASQANAVAASTSIATTLAGGIAGATYEGAVRQGACDRMGATIASLIPATADSLGAARASGDIPIPADSLTRRAHVIVYGRGGRPEVCGAIPGGTTGPLAAPPPPPPDTATPRPPPPSAPAKPAPKPSPGEKRAVGDTSKAE